MIIQRNQIMIDQKHLDGFKVLFDAIYKSNDQAINISFKLLEIAHTWDDLIDKDKYLDDDEINKAFIGSIFEIQNNPLWFQCGLNHHVLNVYLRWRDANAIESDIDSTDSDLIKAYMLRAGVYDIFVIIAYYLYGDSWAKEVGVTVRKFYAEDPNKFIKEVRNNA